MTSHGARHAAERQFQKYADEEFWNGPEVDQDLIGEIAGDAVHDALTGALVNEWVNVVRRARIDCTTKLTALLLASYANPDGTNIYPGVARLAVQSGYDYRTVQRALKQLRDMGLITPLSRKGMPRTWNTGYRLTFGSDTIELANVPSPATEDADVQKLRVLYRGKHRAKPKPRLHLHDASDVQTKNCTTGDAASARHVPPDDLREQQTTLHVPLPKTNPPSTESSVVAPGTGSARAREADGKPRFGSNQEEDKRQAELTKLEAWMKENSA